VDKHGVIDMVW